MLAHRPTWFVIVNSKQMQVPTPGASPGPEETLWRIGNGDEPATTTPAGCHRRIYRARPAERPGGFRRWDTTRFGWRVAKLLNEARARREFDELVLIAPERMLRAIREALDPAAQRCITREIRADLTRVPDRDVARRIGKLVNRVPSRRTRP
jgi:protein required for attachment to host cells